MAMRESGEENGMGFSGLAPSPGNHLREKTEIDILRAQCSRMGEALRWGAELITHANRGAFENGVKDQSGSDEGDVLAAQICQQMRDALSTLRRKSGWVWAGDVVDELKRLREEVVNEDRQLIDVTINKIKEMTQ